MAEREYDRYRTVLDAQPREVDADFEKVVKQLQKLPRRHSGSRALVTALVKTVAGKRSTWVPGGQDVIWIDCNPQVGREMRDILPFLVLSPRIFNAKTSLVIGLPMTAAEYHADNPFAVAVGAAKGRKDGKTSYVLCHQPNSIDWRLRGARVHSLKALSGALFKQVCERLNQIIQLN